MTLTFLGADHQFAFQREQENILTELIGLEEMSYQLNNYY
jgi:hypothetical protein